MSGSEIAPLRLERGEKEREYKRGREICQGYRQIERARDIERERAREREVDKTKLAQDRETRDQRQPQ
jgi:hypothetical protein